MKYDEIISQIIKYSTEYGPTVVASLTAYVSFVRKDLALFLANADKDNDGLLTNTELEDLAIFYIKKSPNLFVRLLPETILRSLLRGLCLRRKLLIRVPFPESFTPVNIINPEDEEGD